ncbi:MAG: DUF2905 domain-containing protein [Chitinophagales bacterium]
MHSDTGKYIMILGGLLFLVGVVIYFFHDKLNGLGHLPGDIRIERKGFKFYFPITTMILISLVLSILLRIFRKS